MRYEGAPEKLLIVIKLSLIKIDSAVRKKPGNALQEGDKLFMQI